MSDDQTEAYLVLINQFLESFEENVVLDLTKCLSILENSSSKNPLLKIEPLILLLYQVEAKEKSEHRLDNSRKLRNLRHFLVVKSTDEAEKSICLRLALRLINCQSQEEFAILFIHKDFITLYFATLLEMLLDEIISSPEETKIYFPKFARNLEQSNLSPSDKNYIWGEFLERVKIFLQEKGFGISIVAKLLFHVKMKNHI